MSRYIVYKYKFGYTWTEEDPDEKGCIIECTNHEAVIEFIVSVDNHYHDEEKVKLNAEKTMAKLFTKTLLDEPPFVMYDFGSTPIYDALDDIRKVFKLEFDKRKNIKVHLWLDKTEDTSYWNEDD